MKCNFLKDLLVTLILKCEKGGIQAISLLMDCITLKENEAEGEAERATIREKAQDILGVYFQCLI